MKLYIHLLLTTTFIILFSHSFAQVNLDSGLVAFLPLNGNTIDISGNGYNGIINGNPSLVPDRFNSPDRAYTFPSQSSNIELANSGNLNLETGFTINAWIKYKSGRQRVIIDKHVCGYPNGFLFVIDWNDQIAFYLSSSGWSIVETNDTFIDDQWYMVTVTYDAGTGTAKVYVDGELGGSGIATYNNFSPYPITIGESYQNNCGPGNMDGAVDEVKIYNRPLSDEEIEQEYNYSSAGVAAHWPFNGNVKDISGNFNDGTNYGGTFEHDRYGVYQGSIYFNGSTSYVEGINPGNNLPTGDIPRSFSCWIKSSEAPSSRNIFHYGTAEIAPTNYHLFMQEGKYVGIGNGYGFGILISNKNIGDGTWHFITTVYEGSSTNLQHIYIDGKIDTSAVISSAPNTVLTNNWKMGQFMGGSQSFSGNVDDLKIFSNALNNQEILNLYQSSTTAPLLIYPEYNTTVNTFTPVFDWDSTVTANYYEIRISTDSTFTTQILDENSYTSSYAIVGGLLQTGIEYYWKVRTINDGGLGPWSEVFNFDIIVIGVEEEKQIPTEYALYQNYPNPFNPNTKISYQLPVSSEVTLKVYDVLGNEVATLVDEYKAAGKHEIEFDASGLTSGIYFYKIQAASFTETKKMLLLK